MDFALDARTEELRGRLLAFMDEHVYPAEPVFARAAAQAAARPVVAAAGRRGAQGRGPRGAACGTSSCPASTAPG